MLEVDSNSFPQKVDTLTSTNISPDKKLKGPSLFKFGENIIFMHPEKYISHKIIDNKITLRYQTKHSINRTVFTHETSMHQFKELEDKTGEMNIEIHFWTNSIFRVRFSADKLPEKEADFPDVNCRMLTGTPDEKLNVSITDNDDHLTISTSKIELKIGKVKFNMSAADKQGRTFWKQRRADIPPSDIFDISIAEKDEKTGCFESFQLNGQEEIYGLGERFDHLTRKGKEVDFWNKDAFGTTSRRTYINVPFLFSTNGYGLFVNSSCRTEWEIGTLDASALGFGIEDSYMDYFLIYGPTPAEIIFNYCQLTGLSPTPPIWSFGLWMSRNSYESWEVVHQVADESDPAFSELF